MVIVLRLVGNQFSPVDGRMDIPNQSSKLTRIQSTRS